MLDLSAKVNKKIVMKNLLQAFYNLWDKNNFKKNTFGTKREDCIMQSSRLLFQLPLKIKPLPFYQTTSP